MKIFGYGTFITSRFYKNYTSVLSVFLPGYLRILRPIDPFPYILRNEYNIQRKGFWGLAFEVTPKQLAELDYYEGSLYERILVECRLKDGSTITLQTYYPTQETIDTYNLASFVSERDLWQEKIIIEHSDIFSDYPELKWDHPPNIK